jgi:hypothetical protein
MLQRTRLASIFAVFTLIAASGCSSATKGGSDGGGDAEVAPGTDSGEESLFGDTDVSREAGGDDVTDPGWECLSSADCAAEGKICSCRHLCVEPGERECTADINCGCTEDAGCSFCDPCTHMCYPQKKLCEPCTPAVCDPLTGTCEESGQQCADYGVCLEYVSGNAFCGQECITDKGCPPTYLCKEIPGAASRQCVPILQDCQPTETCQADAECPYGQVCSDALKVCAQGCQDDDSCGVEEGTGIKLICSAFRCARPCDPINNPCDAGFECDLDGRCKKPGFCLDWRDCVELATYCDPEEHVCKPGCLQDLDCKQAKKECEDMVCVDKACKAAWSCAFGQMCRVDEAAQDYGLCYTPEGKYCEACNGQDSKSCGEENLCANFQDEDGNDLGAFCLVPCTDDPKNRCPQGYQCSEVQVSETEKKDMCWRSCPKPPVTDY